MDSFETSDLRNLTSHLQTPCVSLYMPTHVSGEDGQQDPVRLKNLLDKAEAQLAEGWMRAVEARELVRPARSLPTVPAFWEKRSHGLAVFLAPGLFERFRLPLSFEELVMVNQRFLVKPLFALLTAAERHLLLALSQNKVQLFEADRYHIRPVEMPQLPTNMKEALNYTGADRGSQVHAAMKGRLGKQAAVFHGQGGQPETHKEDLEQFFRMVDAALYPRIRDDNVPLVLAGVDYLLPIYRSVNHYPHLAEVELHGNCDYLTPHELHERAWPVVEPLFAQSRRNALQRFHRWTSTGKATSDTKNVLAAAYQGRVDVLFVDNAAHEWGMFDSKSGEVEVHETRRRGDDDLLDLAAVETLAHRGTVYAVSREDMPVATSAAALMRY